MRNYKNSRLKLPKKVSRCLNKAVSRLESFGVKEFVNKELADPTTYLLKRKGKLLRPTLLFLGAEHIGDKNPEKFVELAVAIELLHTSSLLHDDIIDKDTRRREVPAVHVKYGNEKAILGGDALISKAISESCLYGTKVVDAISKAAMKMCAGEVLDYSYQKHKKTPDINSYLKIATLKSASLIGISTAIAAIYKSDKRANALYKLGENFGIAFQIQDDINDYMQSKKGKNPAPILSPNIVKTFFAALHNEKMAIAKAVELNNLYTRKALKQITKGKDRGLLKRYVAMVKYSK